MLYVDKYHFYIHNDKDIQIPLPKPTAEGIHFT